jgi:UDP-N-acetylmuramyl pentapeptide synthase
MRELGEASQKEHEIIANEIANSAKFAILIGPQMCKYTSQVLDEKKFDYLAFDNFTKAKKDILKNIKKEDVVLVKASQNKLFLERVTKMLLKDKKDVSKLCRQTNKWKKIKEKTQ